MWTRRCKSSSADERGTAGAYNVQSSKLIHPILGSGHANLVTLRLKQRNSETFVIADTVDSRCNEKFYINLLSCDEITIKSIVGFNGLYHEY